MNGALTVSVVELYRVMKAPFLLTENILSLIKLRGLTQHDVAFACRHSDVWLSYVLNNKRGLKIGDLDKIAGTLGVETYQLFQPGISRRAERRQVQRRSAADRRIGQAVRSMLDLRSELERARPPRAGKAPPDADATISPILQEVRRISADYERRVSALVSQAESGGQDPPARKAQPVARTRGRGVRGPKPEKT